MPSVGKYRRPCVPGISDTAALVKNNGTVAILQSKKSNYFDFYRACRWTEALLP